MGSEKRGAVCGKKLGRAPEPLTCARPIFGRRPSTSTYAQTGNALACLYARRAVDARYVG